MFMSLFEKVYKESYTHFNKKPFPPNSLDPQVFYFPDNGTDPVLMPGIQSQIIDGIERINNAEAPNIKTRVWDYVITGPILNKNSSEKCPIIIKVQISKNNLDDATKERILNTIKDMNDKLAFGTLHPIVYIPTIRPLNFETLNAAYHPFKNIWIKKPSFLEESSKTSLDKITKLKIKKNPKQFFAKGLKKLGKV